MRHLDAMAKVMLGVGLIVAYGYMMEAFMSWYSGNPHEMFMYFNRATGPYKYFFWSLIAIFTALVISASEVKILSGRRHSSAHAR